MPEYLPFWKQAPRIALTVPEKIILAVTGFILAVIVVAALASLVIVIIHQVH